MTPIVLAFTLIAIGLLLLLGEMLVPHGVCLAIAVCALVAGVAMTFIWSEDPYTGWLTLLFVCVIVPLLGSLAMRIWYHTPMGRRFFLAGSEEDATLASMPVNLELEQLRGHIGRTLSPLRPAGVTDFDGRRVDTITEGMMVEAGQWVKCIDVRAGKVIVRPIDKPNLEDLESADLT
jgi:membrane-bound serine protease (ClpP class)